MAPKRARVGAIDLTDAEARQVLETHVRAVDCSKERLFVYSGGRKDAPKWKCLHKHRHLLADAVCATRGRLLRMVVWERQVQETNNNNDNRKKIDQNKKRRNNKKHNRMMMMRMQNEKRKVGRKIVIMKK